MEKKFPLCGLILKGPVRFKKNLRKTFAIWHYKVFCQIKTNLEATVKRINTCLLNYFRVFSIFWVNWEKLPCAVIRTCALIYFLKSVDPVRLLGPGLLLGTQEYLEPSYIFLHSMEKKSTKVDFSPISCKKAPFYTRNGHF